MEWEEYYKEPVSLVRFIDKITGFQKPYIEVIKKYGSGKRGLEAGCAEGMTSIYLSHLGYEILGIDNNSKLIEKAKEANVYLRGNARFAVHDIFSIDTLDDKFDFTFSHGVMEHFSEEDIKILVDKQLKVASRVIFSVPSKRYGKKDFGNENLWTYKHWLHILSGYVLRYSFGFLPKRSRIESVFLLALSMVNKNWWKTLKISQYDTQIGFVIEKK